MKPWPEVHPDTIANINHIRRSTALAKYRRKVARCEKLLVASHCLIRELLGSGRSLTDNKLLKDIEDEIGWR